MIPKYVVFNTLEVKDNEATPVAWGSDLDKLLSVYHGKAYQIIATTTISNKEIKINIVETVGIIFDFGGLYATNPLLDTSGITVNKYGDVKANYVKLIFSLENVEIYEKSPDASFIDEFLQQCDYGKYIIVRTKPGTTATLIELPKGISSIVYNNAVVIEFGKNELRKRVYKDYQQNNN